MIERQRGDKYEKGLLHKALKDAEGSSPIFFNKEGRRWNILLGGIMAELRMLMALP